jgi:asparagine synthase (glutamine-hydrolysing)
LAELLKESEEDDDKFDTRKEAEKLAMDLSRFNKNEIYYVEEENGKYKAVESMYDEPPRGVYFQNGNIPAPYTIYQDCFKVEPGHYLQFDLLTDQFNSVKYWDVNDYYNQPNNTISYEEAKQHTEELMTSAFKYRMVADVPVGVFLSGGYDSTAVAALLSKSY